MIANPPTPQILGLGESEGNLCLYMYEYLPFIKF